MKTKVGTFFYKKINYFASILCHKKFHPYWKPFVLDVIKMGQLEIQVWEMKCVHVQFKLWEYLKRLSQ